MVESQAAASQRNVSGRGVRDAASSPSPVAPHPPCPPAGEHRAYQPRAAEQGVLYTIVRDHLETFLREATEGAEGTGLPHFVEQEFRDFLTCGILAHGFARVRCGTCAFERLVPFSCKGRGFCPSCGGRRMTERAAHLVDHVLPRVPIRQWVLSLPHRLRYLLAWNHALCRAVLGIYVRALLGFQRRQAHRVGIRDGQAGAVTVIQRFGGGLNLNVPFHTLVLDGVFAERETGSLCFHPAPPPSDEDLARLLVTIRARIRRLLRRHGVDTDDAGMTPQDPVAEESVALAGIASASVLGRIALGRRAGARVVQLGGEPNAPWVTSTGSRRAHLEGFDLYLSLPVPAADRERLEQLCRYLLRPPVAQDRLGLTGDGRVLLELKSAWADGTSHLLFEPLELLEKLAALTPRPRINLLLYLCVRQVPLASTREHWSHSFGWPAHASSVAAVFDVKFKVKADKRHLNPLGGVHGGFASTVLDSVMGNAVHTMLEAGVGYATVDLNIKMLRAIPLDQDLFAKGKVIYISKRLGISEGAIRDAEGVLLAHGTCTCMILRR